ncbi:MAG: hypothetical protein M3O32_01595, partial [Actinomycetota bacterium]|nr:hypothetical protein [Actinomycetota bacterium]
TRPPSKRPRLSPQQQDHEISRLDEGFGLIAAAFLLSGGAWILGLPERLAAEQREEATLATLRAVQVELAALRAAISPPAARPGS